jgi:hypothetical protein
MGAKIYDLISTAHLKQYLNRATSSQWANGKRWYQDAHNTAQVIANDTDLPIETVIGIIAAMSPRLRWNKNIEYARLLCEFGSAIRLPIFKNSMTKALAIYNGSDPLSILSGPKTRVFYQLILEPSRKDIVCVDTWAARVVLGDANYNWQRVSVRQDNYHRYATPYFEAAQEFDITPSQAQAISWVVIRDTMEN